MPFQLADEFKFVHQTQSAENKRINFVSQCRMFRLNRKIDLVRYPHFLQFAPHYYIAK